MIRAVQEVSEITEVNRMLNDGWKLASIIPNQKPIYILIHDGNQYSNSVQIKGMERKSIQDAYRVTKVEDGSVIDNCFVLEVNTDEAAQLALLEYVDNLKDEEAKERILDWMQNVIS